MLLPFLQASTVVEVPSFPGAESAGVPVPAHGFEGVERQALGYQLWWGGLKQAWYLRDGV